MQRKGFLLTGLILLITSLMAPGGAAAGMPTITAAEGWSASVSGSIIAFNTYEAVAGVDLNGDGDKYDYVIRYYNTSTGEISNTGAVGSNPSISGSLIAFQTHERWVSQDLNNDGDAEDWVIGYYDISTGAVGNTGADTGRESGSRVSISGSVIAFSRGWLPTISYYDISTGVLTNTGAIGYEPSICGSVIAFQVYEGWMGQDLDGDGDATGWAIRYYDISTGTAHNTGAEGGEPAVSGSLIAFTSSEPTIGRDINGDRDAQDAIIRYHDTATGITADTGADGSWPSISGSVIAFLTSEQVVRRDLNGDTDKDDHVIRYYDASSSELINTGAVGFAPVVGASLIAFNGSEGLFEQDANGDGDTYDEVIGYVNIVKSEPGSDISAIKDIVTRLADDGSIDSTGIAEALGAFLDQAQAMIDRGDYSGAEKIIDSFMRFVEAQAGKHITTAAAQRLLGLASAL